MGSGEWVGWLVKGLEREMLEDVVQNDLVKRHVYRPMEWSTRSNYPRVMC